MAHPRRPLLVLVLALGFVGLVGPVAAAGSDVGVPVDSTDDTMPSLTATETVENTTESVDATPTPIPTDSELLGTVNDDITDAESTLSGAVDDTADTADGLLEDTTSDLATGASLGGSLDAAALSTSDRSAETDGTPSPSQTDRAGATTSEAGAAGPPDGGGSPLGTGPVSPLAGGALVGGAALLTGLAGRAVVAGSDTVSIGTSVSRVRDATLGLGADWRDRLGPLLGLFGYQRFDDSDPLEHPGRERLYERIRAEPGVHLTAVSESADLPLSTARYHLRILEHEGLVRGVKLYGKRRYFPPDVEREALVAALAEDATENVLRTLVHEGPSTVSRLAERLDRDPSTVSHHLERLAADGLVERERQGQAVVSTVAPEVRAAVEQFAPDDRAVARPRPAASSD